MNYSHETFARPPAGLRLTDEAAVLLDERKHLSQGQPAMTGCFYANASGFINIHFSC